MQINNTRSRVLDYHKIYINEVLPIFNEFEYIRLDILKEFNTKSFLKYLLPIIILALIGGIAFIFQNNSTFIFALSFISLGFLPSALILMPILYCLARKKENLKFTSMMKIKALQPLLKVFGDIKWTGHDANKENLNDVLLDNMELNKSGLFISYNTRYTDDEFEGSYKDVTFKIAETRMFDIHGSGKNRSSICVFEGVILSFKFNKKINNRTIIATKGDLTRKNQALATMLIFLPCCFEFFKDGYTHWKLILALIILLGVFFITKYFEKNEEALNEVLLEDPNFAKRFNVYSSDQVEARYLVTPAFMHRFYNLKTAFGAKKAKCSFYDNTLMIAINTNKNLFEICNLFKSLQEPSSINEFYRELNSIFKMIEYFKLDEKTGL